MIKNAIYKKRFTMHNIKKIIIKAILLISPISISRAHDNKSKDNNTHWCNTPECVFKILNEDVPLKSMPNGYHLNIPPSGYKEYNEKQKAIDMQTVCNIFTEMHNTPITPGIFQLQTDEKSLYNFRYIPCCNTVTIHKKKKIIKSIDNKTTIYNDFEEKFIVAITFTDKEALGILFNAQDPDVYARLVDNEDIEYDNALKKINNSRKRLLDASREYYSATENYKKYKEANENNNDSSVRTLNNVIKHMVIREFNNAANMYKMATENYNNTVKNFKKKCKKFSKKYHMEYVENNNDVLKMLDMLMKRYNNATEKYKAASNEFNHAIKKYNNTNDKHNNPTEKPTKDSLDIFAMAMTKYNNDTKEYNYAIQEYSNDTKELKKHNNEIKKFHSITNEYRNAKAKYENAYENAKDEARIYTHDSIEILNNALKEYNNAQENYDKTLELCSNTINNRIRTEFKQFTFKWIQPDHIKFIDWDTKASNAIYQLPFYKILQLNKNFMSSIKDFSLFMKEEKDQEDFLLYIEQLKKKRDDLEKIYQKAIRHLVILYSIDKHFQYPGEQTMVKSILYEKEK